MPTILAAVFVFLAVALELSAIALLFDPDTGYAVYFAPSVHVLSAFSCRLASHLRSDNSGIDRVAVFWIAVFVPVFGPCLAWLFPRPRNGHEVLDAHAAFEQYDDSLANADAGVARLPEAWEHEAEQTTPMSFAEILRHGSLDHKRNAVRKLAEIGAQHHLRLLREVLVHETGELRLCAFIELDRVAKRYERQIAEVRKKLAADPRDPETLTALAEAHRALAKSGLLDEEMERYHLEQATAHAQGAWQAVPQNAETARVHAAILCDVDDLERAAACLDDLDEAAQQSHEVRVARARIAFHQRDFATVREKALALVAEQTEVPEWLQVFADTGGAVVSEEVAS